MRRFSLGTVVMYRGFLLIVTCAAVFTVGGNGAIAESQRTCTDRVNKCSNNCEIKYYGKPASADQCERNCNTAYNSCLTRGETRRPLPLVSDDPKPGKQVPERFQPATSGGLLDATPAPGTGGPAATGNPSRPSSRPSFQ
jgi:hypothetical protein